METVKNYILERKIRFYYAARSSDLMQTSEFHNWVKKYILGKGEIQSSKDQKAAFPVWEAVILKIIILFHSDRLTPPAGRQTGRQTTPNVVLPRNCFTRLAVPHIKIIILLEVFPIYYMEGKRTSDCISCVFITHNNA